MTKGKLSAIIFSTITYPIVTELHSLFKKMKLYEEVFLLIWFGLKIKYKLLKNFKKDQTYLNNLFIKTLQKLVLC